MGGRGGLPAAALTALTALTAVTASLSRVGPQPPNHPPVGGEFVLPLRSLQNLRHLPELRVGHDSPKGGRSQRPLPDQLMPVPARAEGSFGVVEVDAAEQVEAKDPVPLVPYPVIVPHQVVADRVEVASVSAERHPVA